MDFHAINVLKNLGPQMEMLHKPLQLCLQNLSEHPIEKNSKKKEYIPTRTIYQNQQMRYLYSTYFCLFCAINNTITYPLPPIHFHGRQVVPRPLTILVRYNTKSRFIGFLGTSTHFYIYGLLRLHK